MTHTGIEPRTLGFLVACALTSGANNITIISEYIHTSHYYHDYYLCCCFDVN